MHVGKEKLLHRQKCRAHFLAALSCNSQSCNNTAPPVCQLSCMTVLSESLLLWATLTSWCCFLLTFSPEPFTAEGDSLGRQGTSNISLLSQEGLSYLSSIQCGLMRMLSQESDRTTNLNFRKCISSVGLGTQNTHATQHFLALYLPSSALLNFMKLFWV